MIAVISLHPGWRNDDCTPLRFFILYIITETDKELMYYLVAVFTAFTSIFCCTTEAISQKEMKSSQSGRMRRTGLTFQKVYSLYMRHITQARPQFIIVLRRVPTIHHMLYKFYFNLFPAPSTHFRVAFHLPDFAVYLEVLTTLD